MCQNELEEKPQIPECFAQGGSEDDQFHKIEEGLSKFIQDVRAFDSKPQVYLVSNFPFLSCCNRKEFHKDAVSHIQRYGNQKLPEIYGKIAKKEDVHYINMHEVLGGKTEQELCDMQQLVSGPGFCDPYHYARPQIMEELNKRLLQPETKIMEKIQKAANKLFVTSRNNVISGAGNATISENAALNALKSLVPEVNSTAANVTDVAKILTDKKQYVYPEM